MRVQRVKGIDLSEYELLVSLRPSRAILGLRTLVCRGR